MALLIDVACKRYYSGVPIKGAGSNKHAGRKIHQISFGELAL